LDYSKSIMDENARNRFFYYVRYVGDCWLWAGSIDRKGYGRFQYQRRWRSVHNLMLCESLGRSLRPTYQANHKCVNRHCCNPAHLYEGTASENNLDACMAGTSAKKLSAEKVLAIRADNRSRKEIAAEYGVSVCSIDNIINRKSWKHI